MRVIPSSELRDGLYVSLGHNNYKIIVEDDQIYYTMEGVDWKISAELVLDVWIETDETIRLNKSKDRNKKINQLLENE